MSNLLQVTRDRVKAATSNILSVEIPAPEETLPHLVTTSKSVAWIETTLDDGYVKATIRKTPVGDVFEDMVRTVWKAGTVLGWGNCHPLTKDGLEAAASHLESHDFTDLEMLVPKSPKESAPDWFDSTLAHIPRRLTSWLPSGCLVLVPRDRSFVGVAVQFGPRLVAAVAHNVVRGMAISWAQQLDK